jgi:zona occludens toxin
MINGLEGIPGSGKSYEAVVMHVLPALKAGRKVITNLPLLVDKFSALDPSYGDLIELRTKPQKVLGVWDAEAVDDVGNGDAFRLFSDGENQ